MLCTVCGTMNDDNLQICSRCGNNITFHTQEHYEFHEEYNQQPDNLHVNHQQVFYRQPDYQQNYYQQPNFQQPIYQQNTYYPQPQKRDSGKVMGIVGFCLAMGSLVLSDGVILAIVGIILSAIGLKKSKSEGFNNGLAKAGLISGIIITVITLLILALIIGVYVFVFLSALGPAYI
ncbi:MAG: DUF4190 domain-containing protein [Clostridia bacterium]|nr:DUF4190 domain-containing protein [Clostridia bacterium]